MKAATISPAPKKKAAKSSDKSPAFLSSLDGLETSTQGMADLLGVTPRWLQMKVKEGRIPSLGRGRFNVAEATKAHIQDVKEGTEKKTGTLSLDALREEKALEIRMNRAAKDRKLISLDEAVEVVSEVTGLFASYLSGLPAEITGVPRERQRLNDIIDIGKQRLADRFVEKVKALRDGGEDPHAEAED